VLHGLCKIFTERKTDCDTKPFINATEQTNCAVSTATIIAVSKSKTVSKLFVVAPCASNPYVVPFNDR